MLGQPSRLYFQALCCWAVFFYHSGIFQSQIQAFAPTHVRRQFPSRSTTVTVATWAASESPSASSESELNVSLEDDIQKMKVGAIKAELKTRSVSYSDCFDRESLVKRLAEARTQPPQQKSSSEDGTQTNVPNSSPSSSSEDAAASDSNDEMTLPDDDTTPPSNQATKSIPIEELEGIRSKRVRELREECAKRQIRWGNFVEKEDLVQAIWKDMQAGLHFSASGALRPGKVTALTGEELDQELAMGETPILLDVFATWCGPCQFLAPQLEAAAAELGSKVRVAKLDSDQYPELAGRLKVGGLPTILVFQNNGEKERVEGAIMKDDLIRLVEPYM